MKTLLALLITILLLTSCSSPEEEQFTIFARPDDTVSYDFNIGMRSLGGEWASAPTAGTRATCASNCLQFVFINTKTGEKTTSIVVRENPWTSVTSTRLRDVVVPVDIKVPARAKIPSTWKGTLAGKIYIVEALQDGKYIPVEKNVNLEINLQVVSDEDLRELQPGGAFGLTPKLFQTLLILALFAGLVLGLALYNSRRPNG
jgi:hypothetical protein